MNLIFFYGPPAVGKLTIAKILAQKTGYKLLHNHLLVNPIAEVFPFENPANWILVREFRLRIAEEAAKSDMNLITTFGIAGHNAFGHIGDVASVVESFGGRMCLIRLIADEQTLLERVSSQFRLEHGKTLSKEGLKKILRENSDIADAYKKSEHLTIDTTALSPKLAAERIIEYYLL